MAQAAGLGDGLLARARDLAAVLTSAGLLGVGDVGVVLVAVVVGGGGLRSKEGGTDARRGDSACGGGDGSSSRGGRTRSGRGVGESWVRRKGRAADRRKRLGVLAQRCKRRVEDAAAARGPKKADPLQGLHLGGWLGVFGPGPRAVSTHEERRPESRAGTEEIEKRRKLGLPPSANDSLTALIFPHNGG